MSPPRAPLSISSDIERRRDAQTPNRAQSIRANAQKTLRYTILRDTVQLMNQEWSEQLTTFEPRNRSIAKFRIHARLTLWKI